MKATYEYKGKVYNFCCQMCIEEFKKDPQKYIKKVEEEKAKEKKAQ
jgi:YHS domain-containing protein